MRLKHRVPVKVKYKNNFLCVLPVDNVYFFLINKSNLKMKMIKKTNKTLKGSSIEYYNDLLIKEYKKHNITEFVIFDSEKDVYGAKRREK